MSIVTLTVNPSIDISTSVEKVMPFHKLRCAEGKRDAGGGGINVARAIRRFGGEVTAIYVAGGTTGQALRTLVEREGVSSIAVPVDAETREDFTVFETSSGDQYRFVLPGPHLPEQAWRACLDALARIGSRPAFVVASGSLPSGVPDDFYGQVARVAKNIGAKIVVDTSGTPLAAALDDCPYLIKPSLRELGELTKAPLENEAAWMKAARDLVGQGRAENVALTLGDRGALLVTRGEVWRAGAPQVKPLSTVGAGDSFLGAMIWELSTGKSMQGAFRHAVAAGTAALLAPGTDLCRSADVERLLSQVTLERLA